MEHIHKSYLSNELFRVCVRFQDKEKKPDWAAEQLKHKESTEADEPATADEDEEEEEEEEEEE